MLPLEALAKAGASGRSGADLSRHCGDSAAELAVPTWASSAQPNNVTSSDAAIFVHLVFPNHLTRAFPVERHKGRCIDGTAIQIGDPSIWAPL